MDGLKHLLCSKHWLHFGLEEFRNLPTVFDGFGAALKVYLIV